ncbi:hypothetical protein [uncultured Prochlorococcus sp.]|uniref:hypothetical protein n=1 Tax=uncultured Prochlorococcus sp. TaxID=159733 RepID=UPI00258A234D|nr:hypothetical protein [uncultured Prochlorococcus sp.]
MVNTALTLIILFGFNSILYINTQKSLLVILAKKEGIRAIEISADIDQISFNNKIEKKIFACNDIKSDYCEDLLEILIQLKNRVYDYRMILINVFDLGKSSKEIRNFIDYENSIDFAIEGFFGLSPKNARQRGIKNLNDYKDEIIKLNLFNNNLSTKNKTVSKLNSITNSVFKDLNKIVSTYKLDGSRLENLFERIKIYLFILITSEIILFLLIYRILKVKKNKNDFINLNNNNS